MHEFDLDVNRQNVAYIGEALRTLLGKKWRAVTGAGRLMVVVPRGTSLSDLRRGLDMLSQAVDMAIEEQQEKEAART